ncbi:sensor histidine kinase [Actinomadura roseirufa]|uniref:sensor histidine kinase n=1 Tax=Actinomadura roseirufa TaxID=2094049 RepID=UPI001041AFA0|nr:ATP-binding protein [Actinomadura roseirufa]
MTADAPRETAHPDRPSGDDAGEALAELIGPPVVLPVTDLPAPRGLSRLRLSQIYRIGSLVLGLLLVLSFGLAGAALYGNNRARDTLIDRVDPATLAQFRVTGALGAQDTAIREYAESGDARRLTEYRAAAAQQRTAAATMRDLLSGVSGSGNAIRLLGEVTAASDRWRAGFAEPIAAAPYGRGLATGRDADGRRLFAAVRARVGPLQNALAALHGKVASTLRERARWTIWATSTALTLVVLAAIALVVLFRRTVLNPVSRMTEQVRAVSQGDFAHPVDVRGPAEIHELAVIVDAMRRRILDEWRTSTEARARLDEQAAELRRSNAELEQFAYVASHDLQEPLRKVASFCQMIERRYGDQLDERGRQYIEFAVDGAKRMQALINDLLGFSRVGRVSRPEESVELGEVARRALDNLSALVEETGAEVEIADLPAVPGDRTQLTQLFQNLIGNAIKFRRPDAAPRVVVDAHRDGGVWEFGCADNGIGIEPRYADRIFLIFQRLHPREEYTGTGIGLALCKKIVEYHGGRIWLDTADRGDAPGTTFHWTLPAGAADDD